SVPAGATGGNHNAVDSPQVFGAHVQPAKARGGVFQIHPAAQNIFNRARLLKDLLEHEMRKLAAFGGFGAKLELADLDLSGVGAEVLHIEPLASEGGHVVVIEINDLARVGDDGISVAGQEILSRPDADDQRRTPA